MMKNILVILDETSSSLTARRLAIQLAAHVKTNLIGLSVVDAPWISAPRATPIGAAHYQAHRNAVLLAQGREKSKKLLAEFEAECAAANVPVSAIGREGAPYEQIDDESDKADLVVIGRETNFHGDDHHDIGNVIDRLLEDAARPCVITPEQGSAAAEPNAVLVAFDGSSAASRSMHMFLLLGLAAGKEVHIVSIGEDAAAARAQSERGARLFREHGVEAEAHPVIVDGDHADALQGAAAALGAELLVMGARGRHSLLRRALIGSTTTAMLRTASLPVFVHH